MPAQDNNNQPVMPPPPAVEGNMPPPSLIGNLPPEGQGIVPPPSKSSAPLLQPTAAPQVVTPPSRGSGFPKIIMLVLVILLAFGLFAFAAKSIVNRTGGNNTLTWWGLWEDDPVIHDIISEYEVKHPGVKINYVKQSKEDYRERLTNAIAQGKGPDIFRFHNSWVPMFKSELDTMPQTVMSSAEYSKTFYPVILSDLSADGGLKGIPLDFDTLGLYINTEIFDTYNKTVPTTWDELRQTALDLTIKDSDGVIKQAGAALGRTENIDHWQEILALMLMQNGVKMNRPEGELAQGALSYFTLFTTTDHIWDKTLPPSTVAFANGKLAMYFGPSWRAHNIKEINPNLKFKVYPVPQLPKEHPEDPSVAYATYWVEGVWKRSPNKDAAWDFLKYLSSKETLQKFYLAASKVRSFGEPYPRVDMANLLSSDPIVGAFVNQGAYAQSWYLHSRTWDGPTGINSQIGKYYEDAINAMDEGRDAKNVLTPVTTGVIQVLSQYGLAKAPQPTQQ